ncbi:uncharacterized protein G2W53_041214 [Senna tora]|uniref:Uncharacterized protein n=1 Tax=Senna tora TaxID=362788 RepID=A0A834SEH1_9FABA|nr:uncharacterized protein G2W53_041214 [Senna tora]
MRSRVSFDQQIPWDSQIQREAIDLTHLCNNAFDMYFMNSLEILSRILLQNVFIHDFTVLPCDSESHSSIKSTRIPKHNDK